MRGAGSATAVVEQLQCIGQRSTLSLHRWWWWWWWWQRGQWEEEKEKEKEKEEAFKHEIGFHQSDPSGMQQWQQWQQWQQQRCIRRLRGTMVAH